MMQILIVCECLGDSNLCPDYFVLAPLEPCDKLGPGTVRHRQDFWQGHSGHRYQVGWKWVPSHPDPFLLHMPMSCCLLLPAGRESPSAKDWLMRTPPPKQAHSEGPAGSSCPPLLRQPDLHMADRAHPSLCHFTVNF